MNEFEHINTFMAFIWKDKNKKMDCQQFMRKTEWVHEWSTLYVRRKWNRNYSNDLLCSRHVNGKISHNSLNHNLTFCTNCMCHVYGIPFTCLSQTNVDQTQAMTPLLALADIFFLLSICIWFTWIPRFFWWLYLNCINFNFAGLVFNSSD